jgi:hypothetical protein
LRAATNRGQHRGADDAARGEHCDEVAGRTTFTEIREHGL